MNCQEMKDTEDPRRLAAEICAADHQAFWHLAAARIKWLWETDTPAPSGRVSLGRAKRPGGLLRHFSGADFIITLREDTWADLTDGQRWALVRHELLHCGVKLNKAGQPMTAAGLPLPRGEGGEYDGEGVRLAYIVRKHEFEGFLAEIDATGRWTPEMDAAHRRWRQLMLPLSGEIDKDTGEVLPVSAADHLSVRILRGEEAMRRRSPRTGRGTARIAKRDRARAGG